MTAATRQRAEIDPANVKVNHSGLAFRQMFVRLPAGMIADDLKEPSIWARVQASPLALRRHDNLYIAAYGEDWVAEAIVADADARQAVLCKPRLTSFPERYERLFEDDTFRVRWMGNGFAVERKADGHRMTPITGSAALAERDLMRLYPGVRP